MTRWTRAMVGTLCGRCGRGIEQGSPLFEIVIGRQVPIGRPIEGAERSADWRATKVRCEACAGEPVPADLPLLIERVSTIQPTAKVGRSKQFTGIAGMARDWKHAQSGGDR